MMNLLARANIRYALSPLFQIRNARLVNFVSASQTLVRVPQFAFTSTAPAPKKPRKTTKKIADPAIKAAVQTATGFNVSPDPEIRQHDLQNFVMKTHELLPRDAIKTFILHIEAYKARVATHSYKAHKSTHGVLFLNEMKKFFEKFGAADLSDYLVKADIPNLKIDNLKSSILDCEENNEIRSKVFKMNRIFHEAVPKSHYLVDDLIANHQGRSSLARDPREIEDVLLSSISMVTTPTENTQKVTEEPETELETAKLDAAEFGMPETIPVIDDLQSLDAINDLSIVDSDLIRKKSVQSSDQTSLQPYSSERVKPKSHLPKAYEVQGRHEQIVLKQLGFDNKVIKKSNWVYLYNLPYEIDSEEAIKEKIQAGFEKAVGKIEDIILFKFSNFMDIKNREVNVKLDDTQLGQLLERTATTDSEFFGEKTATQQLPKDESKALVVQSVSGPKELEIAQKRKNAAKSKTKKTEKILAGIETKNRRRLDRSYALIKLATPEEKERALHSDLRLFGLLIGENICNIDDADYKLTVMVNNVHWGTSLKSITNHLNGLFEAANAGDLRIVTTPEEESKLITKYYVFLRFNSMLDTLRAIKIINNTDFQRRTLKAQHLYGSLRVQNGQFLEMLDQDTPQSLQDRVNQNRVGEFSKIIATTQEEQKIDAIEDPNLVEYQYGETDILKQLEREKLMLEEERGGGSSPMQESASLYNHEDEPLDGSKRRGKRDYDLDDLESTTDVSNSLKLKDMVK